MARRLVFLLTRRPGMEREEFQSYWRERHAPLVTKHAEVLGIRRYQQVHTVGGAARAGTVKEFDGIAELWFDAATATGTVEEIAARSEELVEDEGRFIDLTASPIWMAEEVTLREGARSGLRLNAALRRAPGISREEFRAHWRDVHGPLALQHPDVFGFRHYTQLHTPDDAESFPPAVRRASPPPFDGLSEIWLDAVDPDPGHAADVRAMIMRDEAGFVDYPNSPLWMGRVEPIFER